jgi:Flp pilus assembly pilin Flp
MSLWRDKRGATIVEYGILLFLVLVISAAAYRVVGKDTRKSGDMTAGQFQ